MNANPGSPRSHPWIPVAIFLVAIVVYLPSLSVGFVLDDTGQILHNGAVKEFDLGEIFGRGYWENVDEGGLSFLAGGELYRPLTTLSVAVSYQLHGESPTGYHVENVLLHACASVLVGFLLLTWGLPRATAWCAALLFAVAPIHIEPVASIILRNELLAAIFGVLFLAWHARSRPFLAATMLFLALLCKESAIALPFVALAADHVFPRREPTKGWRTHLPWVGAIAAFLLLRIAAISIVTLSSEGAYFGDAPWLEVWLTMARFGFEHYVQAALIGTPLVFDYSPESYPHASPSDVGAWIALLIWVVLGVGSLAVLVLRRARWAFPAVAFLLLIGPTANVVTRIGVLGATRLMYLPYLGIALALGMLYARGLRAVAKPRARAAIHAILALVALAQGFQTLRRLAPWTHEFTLYEDIVDHAPRNSLALGFLGTQEANIGLSPRNFPPPKIHADQPPAFFLERAHEHLRRSMEVEPKYWIRFVMTASMTASWLDQHHSLDPARPLLTWHRHEAEFLESLAAAIRAEGRLPVPSEPLPAGFAERRGRDLSTAETRWLDEFARLASAYRMSPAKVRELAGARSVQDPSFQLAALHHLSIRWQTLFRIWALLPTVNARLAARASGAPSTPEQLQELRLDVHAILQAAEALRTHLTELQTGPSHPFLKDYVRRLQGQEYLQLATFWVERFRREREGL